jgi:hypothetical protein
MYRCERTLVVEGIGAAFPGPVPARPHPARHVGGLHAAGVIIGRSASTARPKAAGYSALACAAMHARVVLSHSFHLPLPWLCLAYVEGT